MHNWKFDELREKLIATVLCAVACYVLMAVLASIVLGVGSLAHSQEPSPEPPAEYRPFVPPVPNAGLDPIGTKLSKQGIRIYELEQNLRRMEQIVVRQHYQIQQMQQYMFYGRPYDSRGRLILTVPAFRFYPGRNPLSPNTLPLKPEKDLLTDVIRGMQASGEFPAAGEIGSPAIGSLSPEEGN